MRTPVLKRVSHYGPTHAPSRSALQLREVAPEQSPRGDTTSLDTYSQETQTRTSRKRKERPFLSEEASGQRLRRQFRRLSQGEDDVTVPSTDTVTEMRIIRALAPESSYSGVLRLLNVVVEECGRVSPPLVVHDGSCPSTGGKQQYIHYTAVVSSNVPCFGDAECPQTSDSMCRNVGATMKTASDVEMGDMGESATIEDDSTVDTGLMTHKQHLRHEAFAQLDRATTAVGLTDSAVQTAKTLFATFQDAREHPYIYKFNQVLAACLIMGTRTAVPSAVPEMVQKPKLVSDADMMMSMDMDMGVDLELDATLCRVVS